MVTTNQLGTVQGFFKYLNILSSVPNNKSTSIENIGTGNGTTETFWLDYLGVIEGTYTLSAGSTESSLTNLTETTDYTIDLDTSKITLTTSGKSNLSTKNLYAQYKFNTLEILNSDAILALNSAENRILQGTEVTFANSSSSNPAYRKITDEMLELGRLPYDKCLDLYWTPVIKLDTTTSESYTTGSSSISITDTTGFPESGTLYIGGNKVQYTAKTNNVLKIPTSTPSISSGAIVKGEVIEISKESEGSQPSYVVLDPDTEYKIDYLNGRIKLIDNAYWGQLTYSDVKYPSNYIVRASYMHAWYENDELPSIPDEIQELVYMIASKRFSQRMLNRAHMKGFDGITPQDIKVSDDDIAEILMEYKPLNVGSSPYNKRNIS